MVEFRSIERKRLSVVHVISGLELGGAEMMLYRLLKIQCNEDIDLCVVSLGEVGSVGEKIRSLGVSVDALGILSGSLPRISQVAKFIRILRSVHPDVLQGWMYHGNLAATLGYLCFVGRIKLFWNIRQSLNLLSDEKPLTRKIIRLSAWLSVLPSGIIYNARTSAKQHTSMGYSSQRQHYLPNGFEIPLPEYSASIRNSYRKRLGFHKDSLLIGHVARFHPKKDHSTFLETVRLVVQARQDVYFLAAGRDVDNNNYPLCSAIDDLGIKSHLVLLGECEDIRSLMSALDLLVSSSAWGEGFPNVIGEAMAMGTPAVGTDVGETVSLIGRSDSVVPPREPTMLANAILLYLELDSKTRLSRGQEARGRVQSFFDLEQISNKYLSVYQPNDDSL